MCDYVIAPVARYAGRWEIPVLTPGAQAEAFRHKNQQYSTLTRLAGKETHECQRKIASSHGIRAIQCVHNSVRKF